MSGTTGFGCAGATLLKKTNKFGGNPSRRMLPLANSVSLIQALVFLSLRAILIAPFLGIECGPDANNHSIPLDRSPCGPVFSDLLCERLSENVGEENVQSSDAVLESRLPSAAAPYKEEHLSKSPIGYDAPCGVRGSDSNRVVGGTSAEPGEFPWQVSLQATSRRGSRHVCGGALVSSYWVVTAAHCVLGTPKKYLFIVAGDHNLYKEEGTEKRAYVHRVILNRYDRTTFSNDIALLMLDRKIKLDGNTTAPICLPSSSLRYERGYGTVTGWGRLSEKEPTLPEVLQHVTIPLVTKSACEQLYRKAGFGLFLHPCQMCAGYEKTAGYDSCQGDSGGPLACLNPSDGRYYLCGIVSWGLGCGRSGYPGVYTKTSCYTDWIADILYQPERLDILGKLGTDYF